MLFSFVITIEYALVLLLTRKWKQNQKVKSKSTRIPSSKELAWKHPEKVPQQKINNKFGISDPEDFAYKADRHSALVLFVLFILFHVVYMLYYTTNE